MPFHLIRALRVLLLLLFEPDDVLGMTIGPKGVMSNGLGDLIEATQESTHSANADMVLGCAAVVQVIDGGVLAQDVTTAEPVYFVAGVTVFVFVLEKPQGKCALGIILLHIFGGKGNGEKSSKESADVVGGIGVVDM